MARKGGGVHLVNGWHFPDADTFMAASLRLNGTHDKWLYQLSHLEAALPYVTDFSCAIDGGAHVGTWSKVMAERFARVIACEPSPDTFACLDRNLAETTVERRHVALGAVAGSVDMTILPEQAARGNTGARYVQPGGPVPMETIDSWRLPTLGFLKLDIEGSEYAALCGATKTLRRCRPIVLFENKFLWTRHFGIPKDAVARHLKGLGYQFLERISRDEIWGPT